jgi:CIC family chloride channel protein
MEVKILFSKDRLYRIVSKVTAYEAVTGILLAILVGIIAGFGAIVFRWLIRSFQTLFFGGGANILGFMGEYYIILLPAVGGLFVGLLIYFGAREAKGHGVPEVMAAVVTQGGRIRPRVSIIKSLASSICIGSGGSVGREGPIVQIGSSFGSAVGQWLKLSDDWVRTLVACGAAGGISATFNAPIGGVFFAIEVILARFTLPRFGYVVISSVVADVIGRVFLGDQPSFDIVPYTTVSYWELLPYALLGALSALVGFVFIRLLYKSEDLFDSWHIPEFVKPVIGGIGVGLIGLYSHDLFGVGYGQVYWVSQMSVDQALLGEIALSSLIILLILKIIATSLTLGSGGSGGIFAPSLFIGAMLGGAFGTVVHQLFPSITASSGAYAMVGMAAVFAGAAKAPISSIIILFEMTMDYKIILPLLIAVVISTVVSRSLSRESIYTLKLLRRGIDIRQLEQTSPMREITVGEAMTRNFPTILPTTMVSELVTRLRRTGHHGFPVVDEDGSFLGMVTLADVEAAMSKGNNESLTVDNIYTKTVVKAYPDEYIHDVFLKLDTKDVGRIPVVDRSNPKQLLGVLRRHDIIGAYTKAITRASRRQSEEIK